MSWPFTSIQFSSVQSLSRVRLFATPWIAAHQASLSITNSWSSPKLTSIESVMPSSHLILSRPLFLLPPIPPSIRVFSNESTLCKRWPKYWSFSFRVSPSREHPGLISFRMVSFRMDWLDLLAGQGNLKSLLQHHRSKASVLRCSALFIVRLSHPSMTTGKTKALTRRAWVLGHGKDSATMPGAALRGHTHQRQGLCSRSSGFLWSQGHCPGRGVCCQLRAGDTPATPETLWLSSPSSGWWEDPRTWSVFSRNLQLDRTPHITPWQPGKPVTFHRGWESPAQNPVLCFFQLIF